MATLDEIIADVNSAKVYSLQTLAKELIILKSGGKPREMSNITSLKRVIRALGFQINAGVNDADTNLLHNCLLKAIHGFSSSYNIDPSVIIPGQIVIINTSGSSTSSNPFPFNDATDLEILNYQSTFFSKYGNSPTVTIYVLNAADGSFSQDSNTAQNRVYETPGDATSPLLSINWQYLVPTTGYYQIMGIAP